MKKPPISPKEPLQNSTLIQQHFKLTPLQSKKFHTLHTLYTTWNQRVNLISRKDIQNLYLHHILHSLSIAKAIQFLPNASILDLGTGGGLPGIPLAILFPKAQFTLIDSTAKKLKAAYDIANNLQLDNVTLQHIRIEELQKKYDFIVSRAVASLQKLQQWTKNNLKKNNQHNLPNGLLCLKGGDLTSEINSITTPYHIYNLSDFFTYPFFTTKKIVHLFSNPHTTPTA